MIRSVLQDGTWWPRQAHDLTVDLTRLTAYRIRRDRMPSSRAW
jgi:hypothetical protein